MPLSLHRFDDIVFGTGGDFQSFARQADCLVVKAVYISGFPEKAPETALFFCPDPVAYVAAGGTVLSVVKYFAGDQGEILPYCSAAGCVEYLHPPADCEHRFRGGEDQAHKADLKEIKSDIGLSAAVFRLFSEEERGNITSAAEEETVAQCKILGEKLVASDKGEDEGEPSGIADRLDIRVGYILTAAVKTTYNNTDFRFHNILALNTELIG